MTKSRRFIVMSGLAASGKSALGARLAEALELDFIDKDDFLEPLFDVSFPRDRAEKSILSRQADGAFRASVEASPGAVVVSFWRRPEMGHEFGTPFEWLAEIPDSTVTEVHCVCPPEEAVRRFVGRRRHPGHHDIREATEEAVARFGQTAALGPLGLGEPLVVDTGQALGAASFRKIIEALGS